jgi:hypothetical protein
VTGTWSARRLRIEHGAAPDLGAGGLHADPRAKGRIGNPVDDEAEETSD